MIDTLPLGEIGGQHAPLDPPFGHIKDGIEYGPHTQGARSSTAFGGGDHIFDPLPFLVGQVAWIYFFVHLPILHNPRRLFRQALRPGQSNQTGYAYWTCWPSSIGIHKHPLRWPWPCPRLPPVQVPLRTPGGSGVGRAPQAAWWDPTAPRQPRPPCWGSRRASKRGHGPL